MFIWSTLSTFLIKGGGGFRPFVLKKQISSQELEAKARIRPDILRVVLGSYVQYCQCEASEQKLGQKPKSVVKGIEHILVIVTIRFVFKKKSSLEKNNFKIG